MLGPIGLTNDLAVEHEVLLAKEFEHGRDVDQADLQPARGRDHACVAGPDIGAASLADAAELAHRVHAPADALLRLEHEHVETLRLERVGGGQSREARADHDYVVPLVHRDGHFKPAVRADRRHRRERASQGPAAPKYSNRRRRCRG